MRLLRDALARGEDRHLPVALRAQPDDDGRVFFTSREGAGPQRHQRKARRLPVERRPRRRAGSRPAAARSTRSCSRSAPTARTPSSSPATCWSPTDENGGAVKVYDAREGGGYLQSSDAAALRRLRRVPRARHAAAGAAQHQLDHRRRRSRCRRTREPKPRSARRASSRAHGKCVRKHSTRSSTASTGRHAMAEPTTSKERTTMSTQSPAARSSRPRAAMRAALAFARLAGGDRDLRPPGAGQARNQLLRSRQSTTPRRARTRTSRPASRCSRRRTRKSRRRSKRSGRGGLRQPRGRAALQQHRLRPERMPVLHPDRLGRRPGYWEGNPLHVFGAAPLYDMEPTATETARFAFTVPGRQHPDQHPDQGPHRNRLRPHPERHRDHPGDCRSPKPKSKSGASRRQRQRQVPLPGGLAGRTARLPGPDGPQTPKTAPTWRSDPSGVLLRPLTDNPTVCTGQRAPDRTEGPQLQGPGTGDDEANVPGDHRLRDGGIPAGLQRRPDDRGGGCAERAQPAADRQADARPDQLPVRAEIGVRQVPRGLLGQPGRGRRPARLHRRRGQVRNRRTERMPRHLEDRHDGSDHAGAERPADRRRSTSANRSRATSTACSWSSRDTESTRSWRRR